MDEHFNRRLTAVENNVEQLMKSRDEMNQRLTNIDGHLNKQDEDAGRRDESLNRIEEAVVGDPRDQERPGIVGRLASLEQDRDGEDAGRDRFWPGAWNAIASGIIAFAGIVLAKIFHVI